ncbi:hypothetical protein [Methanococcoides methylutens]|uniref:DUF7662 domain-containing protein n=1 Tax=Methanococcoides methylutens MM1 TaxID=1434104 RepID=A0A0E3SRG2_METMT|nr:hypothetical protein [Methanococcoides methylutens]AKB85516.1 hypothetical protein MCMEM_1463 [Methanococcoides methylutens MM1]
MGKYSNLGMYLGNQNETRVQLNFSQIDEILEFPLPPAARNHPAWWTNDKDRTHAMDGWLGQGWKAKVDLEMQQVSFINPENILHAKARTGPIRSTTTDAHDFQNQVLDVMSGFYSKELVTDQFPGIPTSIAMVSHDKEIVGYAQYITMDNDKTLPTTKFSIIAEHVWLLEKAAALHKFLVFGNDRRVPEEWLKKYGHLVYDVKFFFYSPEDDRLERFIFE